MNLFAKNTKTTKLELNRYYWTANGYRMFQLYYQMDIEDPGFA